MHSFHAIFLIRTRFCWHFSPPFWFQTTPPSCPPHSATLWPRPSYWGHGVAFLTSFYDSFFFLFTLHPDTCLSNLFHRTRITSLFLSEVCSQFLVGAQRTASQNSHSFLLHGRTAYCPAIFAFGRNTSPFPSQCPHSRRGDGSSLMLSCQPHILGQPPLESLSPLSTLTFTDLSPRKSCGACGISHVFQPFIIYRFMYVSFLSSFLYPTQHGTENQADGR